MKRSKGFTLIELLTVIAILAIVLLISVPVILGVLEKSKKNNFKNQALLYVDALKKQALINEIDNTSSSITLPDTGSLRIDVKDISMDSASDIDGYIVITKNDNADYTYALYISNGEYKICNKVHNKIDEKDIEKGNGCGDSLLYPTITNKYEEQTYNYKENITKELILNGVSASDATDGDIPKEEITYKDNINTSVLGTYEITYSVKNSLGNYATAKRTIHIKDKEAPIITNVTGNPSSWVQQAILTVEATDNYKLHDETPYSFDDGATWQVQNSKAFTTNGEVKIRVRDKSENPSEVTIVNITMVDSTEPKVSLNGVPDRIKPKDSYSLPTSYTVNNSLSGGSVVCKDGSTVVTNTSSLSEGTHTINCTVTTGSEKTASVSKTIEVSYKIGDQVTLKDDTIWYVIENSRTSSSTVTLFASQNIKNDASGWTTSTAEYKINFDNANVRTTANNSYCTYPRNGCNMYAAQSGIVTNGNISGTVTEDSSIKKFIDGSVKTYINSSLTSNGGIAINSIRLITNQEICNIVNASDNGNNCIPTTTNPVNLASTYTNVPNWLYSTRYWTATSVEGSSYTVYIIDNGSNLREASSSGGSYHTLGARPVIVTNKSNIK